MEQTEEISGLLLRVELSVLFRAEAGRVELTWVSDPNDVVEEAEEEELYEWNGVKGRCVCGGGAETLINPQI